MVTPDEGPVFLLKKLGGLLLVMFGGGLTAAGINLPSTGLTAFGIIASDCRPVPLNPQDHSP